MTLNTVQPGTRDVFLETLLRERLDVLGLPCPSFAEATFELQGHADKERTKCFKRKVILTVATDLPDDLGNGDTTRRVTSSIPDGWIIAGDSCFLIEAKVGTNPLNEEQVIDHAWGWFGIPAQDLRDHHVGLTWHEVVRVLKRTLDGPVVTPGLNEQERRLLSALVEYFHYSGYRHLNGFDFSTLASPPLASLGARTLRLGVDFTGLERVPDLKLAR